MSIDKEKLRAVIESTDFSLPDGAFWNIIAERVGLEVWVVQETVAMDPEFFGWEVPDEQGS